MNLYYNRDKSFYAEYLQDLHCMDHRFMENKCTVCDISNKICHFKIFSIT